MADSASAPAAPISGSAPVLVLAPPRIISHSDGLGLAELGTVGVVLWRGAVTKDTFRRQTELMENLCERYRGRGAMLSILEDSAPPPNDELRPQLVQVLKTVSRRLSGVAVAIESTGFVGAVKRSVIAGMAMLLPRGHAEIKVVANVPAAASWIAAHSEGASVTGLCQLAEALRASL